MIPDKLLINLKIISKIQKNGRIARSFDGIISLENDAFYQSFKRFITNDSRKQAIFEINSVISECIEILNHIINSKYTNKIYYQSNEYAKNCECIDLLLKEIDSAKCGIENLKFTYQNDPNIVSQIDIVLLKINTIIKDFSQKLTHVQNDQYIYYNSTPQEIPGSFDNESISKSNGESSFKNNNKLNSPLLYRQQGTFTNAVDIQQGTLQQGTFTNAVDIQQGTFTNAVDIQQGTFTLPYIDNRPTFTEEINLQSIKIEGNENGDENVENDILDNLY
jgi:phosphoglycerate-specific signal transduction histidine kinase